MEVDVFAGYDFLKLLCVYVGEQNAELNTDILTKRSILLKKYINDEAMELTALYALQRLYVNLEQPPSKNK